MIDEKALAKAARALEDEYDKRNDVALFGLPDIVRAAITAYLAHLAEAGRVIVPVEPTEAMRVEGVTAFYMDDGVVEIYRAMIAARPQNEGE